MTKYLYLAVTADKYELPLIVEDSPTALAKRLGMNPIAVTSSISKNKSGRNTGRKLIKVAIEETNDG